MLIALNLMRLSHALRPRRCALPAATVFSSLSFATTSNVQNEGQLNDVYEVIDPRHQSTNKPQTASALLSHPRSASRDDMPTVARPPLFPRSRLASATLGGDCLKVR